MEARSSAQWSLWLNMAAIISYLALMILGVGLIVAVLSSVTNIQYHHLFLNPQKQQYMLVCNNIRCFLPTECIDFP